MRYAILEEAWVTGNLSYVALGRSVAGNKTTLERRSMYVTVRGPIPADMLYEDRATAERDAALFRLLALPDAALSYSTVKLDEPALATMTALADARMNGFRRVAHL
jgi:hypothetical protein